MDVDTLYIVIPCYNEEAVLPITAPLFKAQLDSMVDAGFVSSESRIMFVDDGSRDNTWQVISRLTSDDEIFRGLKLSRNRGHQNALLAGLMEARSLCDITISIDADGQDDIAAMTQMVEAYRNGAEVVYGVRSSRKTDSFFKRMTAEMFYRFLASMGAEVVFNHADYRLLSSRVLNEFASFKEVNLFLRGLIPLVGFNSTCVYYERHERMAGKSHYPLKKMLGLAVDGITSLSTKPLKIVMGLGLLVSLLSFIGVIWAVVSAVMGASIAGWASTICIICFIGGIQLICLGVVGEYVGKTYMEVKARPRYIISERTWQVEETEEQGEEVRNEQA